MATSLVTGWLLGEDESTKTLIYAVLGQHLLCHVLLITYASQEIQRIGVIFLPVRTDAQQRPNSKARIGPQDFVVSKPVQIML